MDAIRTILLVTLFFLPGDLLSQQTLFTLLSSKTTNIDFVNEIRETDAENVLAYEYFYNGGGVAIGDINNDGLPDIFLTANLKPNKLYLNLGNFQFKDVTKQCGLEGRKGWKTGVTMADVNGDGLLDIYVCYSGKGDPSSRRNELYINQGNLQFKEEAHEYGLDDTGCSTQAIFFDYDIDGDLDMYLVNHNIKAYKNVELQNLKTEYDSLAADKLYRNDGGHFVDVSKQAGITGNPISFGLGVAVADVNNDGWPDIYVSNDYTEQDYLYINNGNGTFSERELYMLSHLSQFSMGNDIADINNDGLPDIFTLDMLPEDNRRQKLLQAQENYELYEEMATNGFHYQFMRNMLHLNNGNGTFSEIGQLSGISNTDWSWAPLFADFDNDGFKDLYISNGYLRDYTNKDFLKFWGDYLVRQAVNRDSIHYLDIVKMMPSTKTMHYVFRNNGDLTFTNATISWGLNQPQLCNGAAYADLDNDGDLDLVINNINAPVSVYRNNARQISNNHFLSVKLKGDDGNTFGLGAKLFCYANGKMQFLEQMPTRGYQSSVSDILHFGLGTAAQIDSLRIIWLNGSMQTLRDIQADQVLELKQADAKETFLYHALPPSKYFQQVRSPITYSHAQIEVNDFKRQPLMPMMYSQTGPKMAIADFNGDGLPDVVIGSSEGQADALFLQDKNGLFRQMNVAAFETDTMSNTTSLQAFDADGDGDIDIYMVSGGYNDFMENDARLQDRLFLNDGTGNFILAKDAIPPMHTNKSCITIADFDKDGDLDVFIGGKMIPGKYPLCAPSYVLQNDGHGHFTNVTKTVNSNLATIGIVSDAKWEDINRDGWPDLVIVGEWMAPSVFLNDKGRLIVDEKNSANDTSATDSSASLEHFKGWWNTIAFVDVDGDGDKDLIVGNWGLNSQLHASSKEPVELFCKDFDDNGSLDPILCCYMQGKSYPYVSRDELLDEIYSMRRKFTSYKSYADATLTDIFSPAELKGAMQMKANCLETMLFINDGGVFHAAKLPIQAQFAPVQKIVSMDANADGAMDLLLLGNNDYPRLKIGKMDANFGVLLLNDGKGNFRYVPQSESGLRVIGDVKDAIEISVSGKKYLLIGINNSSLSAYQLLK